jgi:hypothetical protein
VDALVELVLLRAKVKQLEEQLAKIRAIASEPVNQHDHEEL